MVHRSWKTVCALVALVGLAGCSANAAPAHDPQVSAATSASGGTPSAADDFTKKNMIVTAECAQRSDGTAVTVTGWDARSWHQVARATFALPSSVLLTGALYWLCNEHGLSAGFPPPLNPAPGFRSLFDQNYTRMAVVIGSADHPTHVGYVDRSGQVTDLTGDGGFGMAPKETYAALSADGSTVWFTYQVGHEDAMHIGSRSVSGDHKLVDHWRGGMSTDPVLITPPSGKGPVVFGNSGYFSPDGRRVLADGSLYDASAVGAVIDGEHDQSKGHSAPCGAVGWTGPNTVLCEDDAANFQLADLTAAAPGPDLLPANDHQDHGLVISPDGRRFLFAAKTGSQTDYYFADAAPGTTPTKVVMPDDIASAGRNAAFLEWR